jgi:cation:H+ antiporter
VYIASLVWVWKKKVSHHDVMYQEVVAVQEEVKEHKSVFLTSRMGLIVKLGASFGGVLCASSLTVNSALELSTMLAWPVEAIGATLLALGTSLPEFAISFNSLRRGQHSLAIGPTLGTVLEQSTLILGILALASSQPVYLGGLVGSVIFSLLAFAILCYALIRYERIGRGTGTALGLLLVAYIFYYLW